MKIAVYPGSFDPVTYGHLDIIKRASKVADKLVVGVLKNSAKKPLFTETERVKMIETVCEGMDNIEVISFDGLLIDFVHNIGAGFIVRGLRAITDFEYEMQLALTNRVMSSDIDTIFLTTNLKYSYLSSSIVKEIAAYNGDISAFVEPIVEKEIKKKLAAMQAI